MFRTRHRVGVSHFDVAAIREYRGAARWYRCRARGSIVPACPPPPTTTWSRRRPSRPTELLAWADTWAVADRLDDLVIADDGPVGTFLAARQGEVLSYRQLLVECDPTHPVRRRHGPIVDTIRGLLHRIAILVARERAGRALLDEHGRDPDRRGARRTARAPARRARAAARRGRDGSSDRDVRAGRCAGGARSGPGVALPRAVSLRRRSFFGRRSRRRGGRVARLDRDGPLRWMSWRDDRSGARRRGRRSCGWRRCRR